VPRGKAIWNANGGFVSVLLTHLLLTYLLTYLLRPKTETRAQSEGPNSVLVQS